MLKQIKRDAAATAAYIPIGTANFSAPFVSGLEYGTPARGTWNIVHTGMLIPEAHQIFVCASGCLRGVVLTAAEMGAAHRFSTITIKENNVLEGDMEELIINGVADILARLPKRPPAILLYTSCIHHFMACDLPRVYRILGEQHPDIAFIDCYMNPIMRKSGLTPDQTMRKQMYGLLKEVPRNPKAVNILGNDLPTEANSEIFTLLREAGATVRDITACTSYTQFQEMAEASLYLTYNPAACAGADALEARLGGKHLYLPLSYNFEQIASTLNKLCKALALPARSWDRERKEAEQALLHAKEVIGDTPIEVDYTLTFKPASLVRCLIEHGFHVKTLYVDSFSWEEKADFDWLKANAPQLLLAPTVHASMRFEKRERADKVLALGQKAAYFAGTPYFVNVIENGGMYGFSGICSLAAQMEDAFLNEKNTKELIQIKGMGCGCCG